jgi:hypothetical protein
MLWNLNINKDSSMAFGLEEIAWKKVDSAKTEAEAAVWTILAEKCGVASEAWGKYWAADKEFEKAKKTREVALQEAMVATKEMKRATSWMEEKIADWAKMEKKKD